VVSIRSLTPDQVFVPSVTCETRPQREHGFPRPTPSTARRFSAVGGTVMHSSFDETRKKRCRQLWRVHGRHLQKPEVEVLYGAG